MKNRKWIALALAAAMVGSLTACGGGAGATETTAAAAADTTAAPAADTTAADAQARPETEQVWYTGPCGSPQSPRAR